MSPRKIKFGNKRLTKAFTKVLERASRDVYRKMVIEKVKPIPNGILAICESPDKLFQHIDKMSNWQVSIELAKIGLSDTELMSIPYKVRRLILFDLLSRLQSRH